MHQNSNKIKIILLDLFSAAGLMLLGAESFICIMLSVVVNYFCLKKAAAGNSKCRGAGIAFNIIFLALFKYTNFFLQNVCDLLQQDRIVLHILLPVGISFYTFANLRNLVKNYQDKSLTEDFWEYMLSVVFLPKVISGPITDGKLQQTDKELWERIAAGLFLFSIGYFKKKVMADTFAIFADNAYADVLEMGFFSSWAASLSYTFQIYFDFSGYTDMAVGVAGMLGYELPVNFNSPYQAESVTDFWRRWHISLSNTLRDIVYIPMGGNRNGKIRTYANLFTTFLVSGIWHGAAWTFIAWGCIHGIFEMLERAGRPVMQRLKGIPAKIYTFLVVNFLWVFFRASGFKDAVHIIKNMCLPSTADYLNAGALANDGIVPFQDTVWTIYLWVFILIGFIIVSLKKNSNELYAGFKPGWKSVIFTVILLILGTTHLGRLAGFVYVNF